ncbi:hypothetical protein [Ilumatobacter sp.]|uniref:hypothetical protein n=1 Tax=Ilumatobacter sp. TaxID=1967498 RepID=UPI003AF84B06
MLTTSTDESTTDGISDATGESRLRLVLNTNATTSGLGGLAALLLGGPVDDLLGTGDVPWVRLVGAGLVLFAAFVAWTARASRARLIRDTPAISVGDAAWVIGTVATIALGWYTTSGVVVMGLVGVMVATFGTMQALLMRQLRSDH